MSKVQNVLSFRPVKPRGDTPKAIVSDLFEQVGGVKEVMVRLGVGKSQAYAFSDPQSPEELSFARTAALTGPGASAAAEYLASRAGGVFLPLAMAADVPAMSALSEAVRQHGEAIAETVATLADGKITAAELARTAKEIDEAMNALATLKGALAAMTEK